MSEHSLVKIDQKQVANSLHGNPLLARIYKNRGVKLPQELDYRLHYLHHFSLLKSINEAVDRLIEALYANEKIVILGDFDADGATAATLAMRVLKKLGYRHVDYCVPNRFEYGYGLSVGIVTKLHEMSAKLVITVDNGITSIDGVKACQKMGIDVIITDHHLPGDSLPEALAILNPNQPDDQFPSKNLAGVGVVFYLFLALRSRLKQEKWFSRQAIQPINLANYLDLVALGTIADVVKLDYNNRILVAQGLARIQKGKCCLGIQALINMTTLSQEALVASDIGFFIAPCLNAAGRLKDMRLGIQCLLSDNKEQAYEAAKELNALNHTRRKIEKSMLEQANAEIYALSCQQKSLPLALCLFHQDWHQGVAGILAGRLKERYHRPVAVFTCSEEGILKASVRSIKQLHIKSILSMIAKKQPNLLIQFGGHAQAAGLSLKQVHYEAFKEAFIQAISDHFNQQLPVIDLTTDGELLPEEYHLKTVNLLRMGGPWGQGFPEPLFEGIFFVKDQVLLGKKHLKIALKPLGSKNTWYAGIYFNVDTHVWPNAFCEKARVTYHLSVNYYLGVSRLQLRIRTIDILSLKGGVSC